MSLTTCPNCRSELDIPETLLGGPVRCANCLTAFTPPKTAPVIPMVAPVASARPRLSPRAVEADPPPRKSRTWMLVLLGGCTLIACTCIGSCFGFMGIVMNPKFKPYAAEDGSYAAAFPGDPKPVIRMTGDGREVGGVEVQREIPKERYFVEIIPMNDKEKGKDAQKTADEALSRWASENGGTVESREPVSHRGLPAMQGFIHVDFFMKGNTLMRAIPIGDRIYLVGVSGGINPGEDRAERFIDEFDPKGAKPRDAEEAPPRENGRNDQKKNPFKGG